MATERKWGAEACAKKIQEHTAKLNEFLGRAKELGMDVTMKIHGVASDVDITDVFKKTDAISVEDITMTKTFMGKVVENDS